MAARRRLSRAREALGAEGGSALIETALVLPVVLVLVAGIVMTGRVVHAQVAVQAVVREAARTIAVAPSLEAGLGAAEARALAVADGHGLSPNDLTLSLDAGGFGRGGTVRTTAAYPVSLAGLPLLGRMTVTVTAVHEERIDLYRSRAGVSP